MKTLCSRRKWIYCLENVPKIVHITWKYSDNSLFKNTYDSEWSFNCSVVKVGHNQLEQLRVYHPVCPPLLKDRGSGTGRMSVCSAETEKRTAYRINQQASKFTKCVNDSVKLLLSSEIWLLVMQTIQSCWGEGKEVPCPTSIHMNECAVCPQQDITVPTQLRYFLRDVFVRQLPQANRNSLGYSIIIWWRQVLVTSLDKNVWPVILSGSGKRGKHRLSQQPRGLRQKQGPRAPCSEL